MTAEIEPSLDRAHRSEKAMTFHPITEHRQKGRRQTCVLCSLLSVRLEVCRGRFPRYAVPRNSTNLAKDRKEMG